MITIIALLAGAALGGGGVYIWHRKTILKIGKATIGSGEQPPH